VPRLPSAAPMTLRHGTATGITWHWLDATAVDKCYQ
jgi:hypothetical protein